MPSNRMNNLPLRRLIILGSTGSIGRSTLAVVEHLRRATAHGFEIAGLASRAKLDLLIEQARRFGVANIAIAEARGADSRNLDGVMLFEGDDAACRLVDAVARPGDLIVGAMVGSAGLPAILAGIRRGCHIALANKETLVAAGALVIPLVREHGVSLIPVDSEHSAIFQCLGGSRDASRALRVVLTASGGPFRTWPRERIENATVEEALNHPTWNMGSKVTIDSATLMNKALEVIEAHWLFDLSAQQIDAIVHPQSIVHSFVEFRDGSIVAQMSPPDMRAPIQYALTWPDRVEACAPALDWSKMSELRFEPVDHDRFPSIGMAWRAVNAGGTAGAILNAANEIAVHAFLERRIAFGRITSVVRDVVESLPPGRVESLEGVLEADRTSRECAMRLLESPAKVYG
jgi:1-deoxy-D-xylulose-5-phosphate reductoisomerase